MVFPNRPIRRTQLISPWGVGAIVPFPDDESLMIAGLDMWQFGDNPDDFLIEDERLTKRLGVKELRCPPDFRDPKEDPENKLLKIPTVRFPRWQYCPVCGTMSKSSYFSSKRDVCDGYRWEKGITCTNRKYKRKLIPERFIVVCPDGHIDDLPIELWLHNNPKNPHTYDPNTCRIRRSTGGTSAALTGVYYECSCGAKRSLGGIMTKGALEKAGYRCKGAKPWLGIEEDEKNICHSKEYKVVQRGGTNVWFADVRSSIHIPVDFSDADRRTIAVANELFPIISRQKSDGTINGDLVEGFALSKKVDPKELYEAIRCLMEGKEADDTFTEDLSEEEYRLSEYNALNKTCGNDNSDFRSKNAPVSDYDFSIHEFFKSISLVPKLRETRALAGFSRLQPNDAKSIEDKKKMLRIGSGDWLPAIQVFGEGLFFEFDNEKLEEWSKQPAIIRRMESMNVAYNEAQTRRNGQLGELNANYVMIHTFAHILINQLSYECGYGSSSIRERIYCDMASNDHQMFGVLVYTASGDSEGSMGGLVRQGIPGRIEDTVLAAIENAKWCSADPICIQSLGQGTESCNLAACHNCALLSETCCETGNKYLDRALLVGTIEHPEIGYFIGEEE